MSATTAYRHCQGCGRPMRPRGSHAGDHPGTVVPQTTSTCATCRRHETGRAEPRSNHEDDVARLHAKGLNDGQIAAKIGLSASGVAYIRKRRLGLAAVTLGPTPKADPARIADLSAKGVRPGDIAIRLGVHADTVRRVLRELGIRPAKRGPSPQPPVVFVKAKPVRVRAAFADPEQPDRFAAAPCRREGADDPMADGVTERRRAALACQDCPLALREECRRIATATRAVWGVWGGVDLAPGRTVREEVAS